VSILENRISQGNQDNPKKRQSEHSPLEKHDKPDKNDKRP